MAEKKKIALIGPAYPLRGGISDFNTSLARSFQKAGHEVTLWSFSLQYPSILFPGKTQFDTDLEPPADLHIQTTINSINPLTWWSTAKKILASKPDYVIVRYWLPFMAPSLGKIVDIIKSNSNVPVIAITDNVIPHESRFGDAFLTKYFVNKCDAFVAMSSSVLEDLNLFTSNQNKVFIPHPIYDKFGDSIPRDAAVKALNLDPDCRYILFFGFIRKYKGLDLLLEALGEEQLQKLGVKLVIAGEFYDDQQYYDDLIVQYGIEDRVIMRTGFIPEEEVRHYFCAADMVTQPYRSATQSGITQIAYNFERPMLVTNTGGLPEIVPNGKVGYVVEPDPRAISDAIAKFYNGNLEEEFAANAALEKERFSWKSFVRGLEKLASGL